MSNEENKEFKIAISGGSSTSVYVYILIAFLIFSVSFLWTRPDVSDNGDAINNIKSENTAIGERQRDISAEIKLIDSAIGEISASREESNRIIRELKEILERDQRAIGDCKQILGEIQSGTEN